MVLEKFLSRKLIMTVLGLAAQFMPGLPVEATYLIIAYIASQGGVDVAREVRAG
ncbi:MAG: hypothetical protein OEZ32_14560 [Nitrospinota bacterium]|nr:hypothetical protein [Nitrospinota bacterium]